MSAKRLGLAHLQGAVVGEGHQALHLALGEVGEVGEGEPQGQEVGH